MKGKKESLKSPPPLQQMQYKDSFPRQACKSAQWLGATPEEKFLFTFTCDDVAAGILTWL